MKKWICAAALLGFQAVEIEAETDWPHVKLEVTSSTYAYPVHVTHAGDGSGALYIVEKRGTIKKFSPSGGETAAFLDIISRVQSSGYEQGLLSVAFPPDYAESKEFYVNYTRRPDGATVVSRFSASNGTANPASEQILLTVAQPAENHNGGQIVFGPDGYLYIGMGDGGEPAHQVLTSQDPSSLLGKILRIDPRAGSPYGIPPNNPYVSKEGYRPEIWAMGFRNPWRFSFDRKTGELFIADVGEKSWEEINIMPPGQGGGNYGWPYYEGDASPIRKPPEILPELRFPDFEIPHATIVSLTGGFMYRGPEASDLRISDSYIFADWASKGIFAAKKVAGQWDYRRILGTDQSPTSFGESETGELYVACGNNLFKVVPSGQTHPPDLSLQPGYYETDQETIVTCLTPGAKIHYTSQPRDPTEEDPFVMSGEKIPIAGTMTLRCRAFRPGLMASPTTSREYNLTAKRPWISDGERPFYKDQLVTVGTETVGGRIHYTLDGSAPGLSDPYVMSGGTILIDRSLLLRVRTFKGDYTPSEIRENRYSFKVEPAYLSPGSSTVQAGATVNLVPSKTTETTVYFTTDGSTPTLESPQWEGPLVIDRSMTIKLWPAHPRYDPAEPATYSYGIQEFLPNQVSFLLAGNKDRGFADGRGHKAFFDDIRGICLDEAGNIFVTDQQNRRIRKIDVQGNVSTYAGTGTYGSEGGPRLQARFASPSGICFDREGRLYVADPQALRMIDTSGQVSTVASLPESPHYNLAPGPNDTIYIGCYQSYPSTGGLILRYTPGGNAEPKWKDFSLSYYPDIATNGEGSVFAGSNYSIARCNLDGTISNVVRAGLIQHRGDGPLEGAGIGSLRQIAFDAEDRLYFLDGGSVRRIENGNVKTILGAVQGGAPEGFGHFAQIEGVDFCVSPDGLIHVATANQIFTVTTSYDSDEDGVPDAIERIREPFELGLNDAILDSDGDGVPNKQELYQGSDPADPGSDFSMEIHLANDRPYAIGWSGSAFQAQELQYSFNLREWIRVPAQPGYGNPGYRANIPRELQEEPKLFFRVVPSAQMR